MWLLLSAAVAAEPEPGDVVPEPAVAPNAEADALRAALQELEAAHARAVDDATAAVRLGEVLDAATVLLDDRQDPDARVAAAARLAADGGDEALVLLRAAARDADPEIRLAVARAALEADGPGSVEPARLVLLDPMNPKPTSLAVVEALGDDASDDAGRVLWDVTGTRQVPARVRSEALDTLSARYPDLLAGLGPQHTVVDPLGGVAFVGASGLAGGILLSSVGVWGRFDGAEVIGAIGGSAIGIGGGIVYAGSSPLTSGEGLAFASGVSWGLAAGALGTTTAYGGWRWIDTYSSGAVEGGAALRAIGVGAGAGLGAWALSKDPDPWDVLEFDTATYLGSAVVLAGTGLAFYRPPPETTFSFTPRTSTFAETVPTRAPFGPSAYWDYRRTSSQWLAGSTLIGAGLGATGGLLLADRWQLDWNDAAFAFTLGLEGAWIGTWTPAAVEVDDTDLKGSIRLPWHLAAIGGLVISEVQPVSFGRTGSTAWVAASGNALGAGLPLLAANEDETAIARVMVPMGAAGTVAGYLLHPSIEPTAGDWTMIGVGTSLAAAEGALFGTGLDDLGVWVDEAPQISGLTLTATGVTGLGLWGLSAAVDPKADDMVLIGAGALWGGFYGLLVPVATGSEDTDAWTLIPATTVAVGALGTGLAELPAIGLRPRSTLVPQLSAVSGATAGALFAAMLSDETDAVALGAVIGSAAGFGVGAGIEVARPKRRTTAGLTLPRLPGTWMPSMSAYGGVDGQPVPTAGVAAHGW